VFDVNAVRVAMGLGAKASGLDSTALGYDTTASGACSTASGDETTASGAFSTASGFLSTASGNCSTALGYDITASGFSSIALGYGTIASGDYSTALGYESQATNNDCLVWSDASSWPSASSTNDSSVTMRASGGYRLFSNPGMSAGVSLAPGSTAWATLSDRNAKKDFAPVDSMAILEKLTSLPVTRWHYQWEEANSPLHLGPMAQDFKAAFYPGTDNTTITTLEFDGVELAAIQGLNEKVESGKQKAERRIEKLEIENAELKQSVAELKALVEKLAGK
jgi:hypothetical protein